MLYEKVAVVSLVSLPDVLHNTPQQHSPTSTWHPRATPGSYNNNNVNNMAAKIIKKTLEEAASVENAEIDFSDKALVHLEDMSRYL